MVCLLSDPSVTSPKSMFKEPGVIAKVGLPGFTPVPLSLMATSPALVLTVNLSSNFPLEEGSKITSIVLYLSLSMAFPLQYQGAKVNPDFPDSRSIPVTRSLPVPSFAILMVFFDVFPTITLSKSQTDPGSTLRCGVSAKPPYPDRLTVFTPAWVYIRSLPVIFPSFLGVNEILICSEEPGAIVFPLQLHSSKPNSPLTLSNLTSATIKCSRPVLVMVIGRMFFCPVGIELKSSSPVEILTSNWSSNLSSSPSQLTYMW